MNIIRPSGRSLIRPLALASCTVVALLAVLVAGPLGLLNQAEAAVTTDVNILAADGVTNRAVDTSTDIDAEVWAMESVGSTLLTGGKFRTVRDRSARADVPQRYLAAFDANTGDFIPWFRPQVDGPVYDIVDVGNDQVLIAGEFTSVNGVARTAGLARLNLSDGSVDTTFVSSISGGSKPVVRSVAVAGNTVYAGGSFSRHVGPDGTPRSTGLVIKISRANGALDTGFAPSFVNGGVWGVAYNSTYNRLFAVGFYDTVNGVASPGFAALDPATGANSAGYTAALPSSYTNQAASLGPQLHDVETSGDRVIVTTKHHLYMVFTASSGSYINGTSSNGTQRVSLSRDGAYAYVGCHCDGTGYLRVVDLATGQLAAAPMLKDVRGTAGVWAIEELPNGCVWTGGALDYDTTNSRAVYNMLRLCNSSAPSTLTNGLTASTADRQAPSTPGAPQVTQSGASVDLTWTAASDNGQFGYIVYRDGAEVGRTGSNRYTDPLVPVGVHQWSVAAVDLSGNRSEASGPSGPLEIGQAVNIAGNYAFQASPGRGGTTPAALTDGNLSSYWYPDSSESAAFYFQVDMGQPTPIDYVLIHESDVQSAGLGLAAGSVKLSHDTFPEVRLPDAASPYAFAALRVDRYYRATVRLDVSALARSVRLDSYANYGQAIDEFEIYTTRPLPTPPAPAPDTGRPVGPTWKRTSVISDQAVLEWGGDHDDRAVVLYEVWTDGGIVGQTPLSVFPVPSASERAADYSIVAIDQAGNRSVVNPQVTSTGRPAEQSSVYAGADASRAVDGNIDGAWANGSVAHTNIGAQPWWQVDLGSVQPIESVRLWNRTDCCAGRLNHVNVFVSDRPFPAGATVASLGADPAVTRYDLGPGALGTTTTVPVNVDGRYVRVMLDTTEYLGLAEVEVTTGTPLGGAVAGPVDTERPSRPTGLNVTSADGAANLTWSPATDNVGVTGYQVFRTNPDGTDTQVATTDANTTYTDTTVTPNTTYAYYLKAIDAAGNTSWRTGAVTVDIVAVPTGGTTSCTFTRDGTNVTVSWTFGDQPEQVVVERSVNGGTYWWRGAVAATDGSFTDADRSGTLAYRTVPKVGSTKGAPVDCTEG
ncbi:MAG: discoidin domain-containing protein [Acidimicrobiales bacterium]